jgi:dihydroneopterin aldolase
MLMAGDSAPRRDKILLRGSVFFGFHGVNPEEQALGQRFRLDVTLWADLAPAAASDAVADTISYATVYKRVRALVEGPPSALLEHLAGRICDDLLALDPRIGQVRVRVIKLSPPLKGSAIGTAGVELTRGRD